MPDSTKAPISPSTAKTTRRPLPESVHFIGICGKGMSGLALALAKAGVKVSGSDETDAYGETPALLEAAGIPFHRGFDAAHIAGVKQVVLSRQYSRGNIEVEAMLNLHLHYDSLPGFILEYFLQGQRNAVVAGTKGKTTTTAMLAWILDQAGLSSGRMIGGIPKNALDAVAFPESCFNVIEGDDYETLFWDPNPKFAYYRPEVGILTNVYPDHPEYHGDDEGCIRHFRTFVSQLPSMGVLLTGCQDALTEKVAITAPCPVVRVGFEDSSDIQILDWEQNGHQIQFRLEGVSFYLKLPGKYNAVNAALASLAARHYGVPLEQSAAILSRFLGVLGRQDLVGSGGGIDLYRDLAYLPDCLSQVRDSFRQWHPGRRLVLFYEPFIVNAMPGMEARLAEVMKDFDLVLLANVYQPRLGAPANPGFSADLTRRLQEFGTPVESVGGIPQWNELASRHTKSGDVILAITHPKSQDHLTPLHAALVQEACVPS